MLTIMSAMVRVKRESILQEVKISQWENARNTQPRRRKSRFGVQISAGWGKEQRKRNEDGNINVRLLHSWLNTRTEKKTEPFSLLELRLSSKFITRFSARLNFLLFKTLKSLRTTSMELTKTETTSISPRTARQRKFPPEEERKSRREWEKEEAKPFYVSISFVSFVLDNDLGARRGSFRCSCKTAVKLAVVDWLTRDPSRAAIAGCYWHREDVKYGS